MSAQWPDEASVPAIGLMSGTSQDGIDVALLETDGEIIVRFGPTGYRPYSDAERDVLRRATQAAATLTDRSARPGVIAEAEHLVTAAHAEAVAAFLAANAIKTDGVAVIGFHGQTVLHRPERRLTIQVGNGPELASRLGIPVVYDFRAADVAAGGQGAPFAPLFHRAMVHRLQHEEPVAVVNIGGVANVTYIEGDTVIACDTGPGNALLDDFVSAHTGQSFDAEGRMAAAGVVDEAAIKDVLMHPFFAVPPPKSLDRNDFNASARRIVETASVADGAATLTGLTAAAIARIVSHLPIPPKQWLVAGGGAHNPTLMRMLAERLAPARVQSAADAAWSTDAIEAQAFAYLAVRSRRGLPLSLPSTTGVPRPLTGGVVAMPGG